jgi:hypothetical protein
LTEDEKLIALAKRATAGEKAPQIYGAARSPDLEFIVRMAAKAGLGIKSRRRPAAPEDYGISVGFRA